MHACNCSMCGIIKHPISQQRHVLLGYDNGVPFSALSKKQAQGMVADATQGIPATQSRLYYRQ